MENKICLYCKKNKSIDNFYVIKDKIDYYCIYCRNANSIKGQLNNKRKCSLDDCKNPNYANELCRIHYSRKLRTGSVERQRTSLDIVYEYDRSKYQYRRYRKHHLMRTYKMTMEEFDEMAKNGCWICGAESSGVKRLHVEHDHNCCGPLKSCGKCVRGIVCNKCNILIGKYETKKMRNDNPHRDKIITYLLNYRAKRSLL